MKTKTTWMSKKESRRLAVLVAGTLGLTAALVACPSAVDMRAAGVEIGSSIAYAAETTKIDVSTWDGKVAGGQTVTLTKDGKELATFTTTEDTTFTYETKADGSHKVTGGYGHIEDLTIHANTEVNYTLGRTFMDEKATLDGSGATYSQNYSKKNETGYQVIAATAEENTGTLTYQWTNRGYKYMCTGNTKISAINTTNVIISGSSDGVVELHGVANDGSRTLTIEGGTTVDTGQAKITVNKNSTISVFYNTTSIGSGNYGDIKKSEIGTGTLTFANDANLTVNNLEADTLQVQSITADNLNVNTLRAIGGTGVTVNDTLTVGNVYLSADNLTAGTIIATGDISSPQLADRITVTTGDLTARNIDAIGINVETGSVNASGNILVNEGVDVKGNLKAGNVTAQEGNITVAGNLEANNVDAQNNENKQDGCNITAASINATGNVTANKGNVNVTNNLAANNVSSNNITAASITATGNVSGNTVSADTIAATTLSVINELKANTVTADTVSLAEGATATGKTSENVTIKTNTLKIDPTADLSTSKIAVEAKTSGRKVNIVDVDGNPIKDTAALAKIADAVGLEEGSYVSTNANIALEEKLETIANGDPFAEKLPTMDDFKDLGLAETELAETRAKLAQAYRASEPVRALVNATANAGAAATQAVTSAFTLGAATRTADLRAGAPASAVVDKGAESDVSSLWLSIKGGETKVDGGDYADTRVRVTTYQAGYDFQLSDVDFLGVFFGTASGYAQTEGAYSKRVDIKHAMNYGLYGTHAFRHGQYLDYLLQGGAFDNKIEG